MRNVATCLGMLAKGAWAKRPFRLVHAQAYSWRGCNKKGATGPFFVVIVQSASVGNTAYRASDAHPVAAAGQVVGIGAQLALHEIASAICADCGAPV